MGNISDETRRIGIDIGVILKKATNNRRNFIAILK